ncbi:MAG: tetratricopeptide repeat protein [Planctomycetes bacterium]|nr:tetratricopeptide repeat protein [Planctomycetota bacterium]MBI3846809.1 tetratricopeptide repeat protein [Planctomycetota bacterium]
MLTRMARVSTVASLLAASALAVAAPAKITIVRKSGGQIEAATVSEDNFKEVVYKLENVNDVQRIPARDVREVVIPDLADGYAKGKELRDKGQWESAVNQFKAAAEKESAPARRQYPLFELAETTFRWSSLDPVRTDAAIAAYQKLLSDVKDTRFFAPARLNLARCYLAKKDFAKAEETLTSLENEAREKYGIEWEVRAKYWKAVTIEQKGNYGEAQTLYASLERTAKKAQEGLKDGSPELGELKDLEAGAVAKQGECLITSGKLDDAQRYYEGLLSSRPEMKAGASNGLGQVMFQKQKLEEARFQFANVVARFFENRGEYQKALYWLGRCYEELGKAGKEKTAADRAVRYFEDAEKVDPTSPIGIESRQHLKTPAAPPAKREQMKEESKKGK